MDRGLRARENQEARAEVMELLRRQNRPFKPKQWHASKLVCCERSAYYWWAGAPWEPEDRDALQLTFSRGKAHHQVLEVYPDKEIKVERDGVLGTVDMKGDRVTEVFTTTVGLNRVQLPEAVFSVFSIKTDQLKCYLSMVGDTVGDLMIFYLFGDYSRPIRPELKVYTLDFDADQLELHWQYRLKRRQKIELLAQLGQPPVEMGEEYECSNCGYRHLCKEFLRERYHLDIMTIVERMKDGDVVL